MSRQRVTVALSLLCACSPGPSHTPPEPLALLGCWNEITHHPEFGVGAICIRENEIAYRAYASYEPLYDRHPIRWVERTHEKWRGVVPFLETVILLTNQGGHLGWEGDAGRMSYVRAEVTEAAQLEQRLASVPSWSDACGDLPGCLDALVAAKKMDADRRRFANGSLAWASRCRELRERVVPLARGDASAEAACVSRAGVGATRPQPLQP